MNILQVMGCTSNQYASMERYLVEKARILKDGGSNLFVIYEELPKSIQFKIDFLRSGGKLYGIRHGRFPDFDYFVKISKLIKKNHIDIVHSYFSPTCHYLNLYLTLMEFRKVVRTAPNLPLTINRQKKPGNSSVFYSLRHRLYALPFKKIICRSQGVMDEYKKLGISSKKLVIDSGGVDVEKYRFSEIDRERIRKEQTENSNSLVLGVACRLVSIKRIDKLIGIIAGLGFPDREVKLWIAGDGPERGRLRDLVHDLELESRVVFFGQRDDICPFYSALDLFCLPSLAEGMSNSILEAMASELPIIATDLSSNRGLIDEGKGGYLISFRDSGEFQDRVSRLLDEEKRKKMGRHNRNKVISQYSLRHRVEKEFRVYDELVS